jgi:lysophospholipase L1-like esterase
MNCPGVSRRLIAASFSTVFCLLSATFSVGAGMELCDGDRIALVGDGLVEHSQFHAQFEMRLARRFPDLDVKVRNFGWTGDTVRGDGRVVGFEKPAGKARLLKELGQFKPTIVVIGYGMSDSLESGAATRFKADLTVLLDEITTITPRILLLTPIRHEAVASPVPLPAQTRHNRILLRIAEEIHRIGSARALPVVDLLTQLDGDVRTEPAEGVAANALTSNGIHLNSLGYWHFGRVLEEQFANLPPPAQVHLSLAEGVISTDEITVTDVETKTDGISFRILLAHLPPAAIRPVSDATADAEVSSGQLKVTGLSPGTYELRSGDILLSTASAKTWAAGAPLIGGPDAEQANELLKAILAKNKLWFRQLRPYNDMHRHWGYIGDEFGEYSPLISSQEKRIADLRRPTSHRFSLTKKR